MALNTGRTIYRPIMSKWVHDDTYEPIEYWPERRCLVDESGKIIAVAAYNAGEQKRTPFWLGCFGSDGVLMSSGLDKIAKAALGDCVE